MELDPNLVMGVLLLGSVGTAAFLLWRKFHISKVDHSHLDNQKRLLEKLDSMLRVDPTNALAVWRKGQIYEALGNDQQAIQLYRTAHMMCPKAFSTREYTEAFVRITKSKPDLRFRLHAEQQPQPVSR